MSDTSPVLQGVKSCHLRHIVSYRLKAKYLFTLYPTFISLNVECEAVFGKVVDYETKCISEMGF